MASASVNNIGMSPENFMDCSPAKFPPYGWMSPRLSFSRDEEASKGHANKLSSMAGNAEAVKAGEPDLDISGNDFAGFEFRLEDPATMLPADELFADGKLVPLHLSAIRHSMTLAPALSGVRSPETPKSRRRNEISPMDPYLFSPKAPRCSSRWKELLGLKKLYQNSNAAAKQEENKTTSSLLLSSHTQSKNTARGLKHFLHRSSKSSLTGSADSSLNLPLLKDSDNESVSISARLSLSSSSSGHEHEELPRLSLDSDKPGTVPRNTHQTTTSSSNFSRVRVVKHRTALPSENPTARVRVGRSPMKRASESSTVQASGVSVDSPRMNSSGKIVFQSLARSSSSPSSFNGGPRYKHRGMERSYSANVRVTPVLNVPVCSLRGSSKSGMFGLFSSQQKKENVAGGIAGSRSQQHHYSQYCRNRIDRT